MHYFKMNIGDYAKKAGRLSMLEHGAYTLLIHACYDRERFPTLEDAYDWCWVRTDEEKQAVEFVLKKFFTIENGVYVQNRIQEEIDKYHENSETNKRIAIEREEKRKCKTRSVNEACSSVNEPPPNQEPLTTNHKPEDITHTYYPSQQSRDENENNSQKPSDDPPPAEPQPPPGKPTPAASVCLSIKKHGIIDVNPAHPELLMLIEAGATIDEFVYAARTAKDKGKGFAYVLGIVKGQRKESMAASSQVLHGDLPNRSPPVKHRNYQKFNALDAINGGDGYGNKPAESEHGRIIDIGGEVAGEESKIQKLISN